MKGAMENYTIKSPSDFITMPWKNGLGSTVEILKQDMPGGDQFAWRLSMADVTTDGPFSHFNGYDRTLLLLNGHGMTLSYSTGHMDLLDAPLQAVQFRGEAETIATLVDGPIKDFNVMTLRNYCSAEVVAHSNAERQSLNVKADCLLIYAVENDLEIELPSNERIRVCGRHLLVAHPAEEAEIACFGGAFIAVQILLNNA